MGTYLYILLFVTTLVNAEVYYSFANNTNIPLYATGSFAGDYCVAVVIAGKTTDNCEIKQSLNNLPYGNYKYTFSDGNGNTCAFNTCVPRPETTDCQDKCPANAWGAVNTPCVTVSNPGSSNLICKITSQKFTNSTSTIHMEID